MDDTKRLLGKRIKELRLSKGLSQEKLAELVEIDQRSLSYIERGNVFPSKCLDKMAKALNVEVFELFSFSHCNISPEDMKARIIKNLENLSFENIKIIYRFIQSMR